MGYQHICEVQYWLRTNVTYWEGVPSMTDVRHAKVTEFFGDIIYDGKVR